MSKKYHFLIIDGYSAESRDELEQAGMSLAWKLFVDMLLSQLKEATYDILLPSDDGVQMPGEDDLTQYSGILWTGCNLSITELSNPSVRNQIALAQSAYAVGIPSFGSCWGLQVAAVAAGGKVEPNPNGREMGLARKIYQTTCVSTHPMFKGRDKVFDAFTSHDDIVTQMPEGGIVLAGNLFSPIQAAEIKYEKGVFWAVQYHPEYTLHEMARLIIAREQKLIEKGFFKNADHLSKYVDALEELSSHPERSDLRWQLAVDDDILDKTKRCTEFINWLERLVLPQVAQKG